MIVRIDLNEIEEIEENIFSLVDKLRTKMEQFKDHVEYTENCVRLENPYIVKAVLRHIAAGTDLYNACLLVAKQFHTNEFRVRQLVQNHKKYMSAVNLYARRFCAEKLKNAGFSAKKIAEILGVSENHVYKLLKCKIDLDNL